MTATTHNIGMTSINGLEAGSVSGFVRSPLWRLLAVVFGLSLIIACVGVWVLPGSLTGSGNLLLRLLVTVAFLLGGLALMQQGTDNTVKELRFDALNGTLYVVRSRPKGRRHVLASYSYDDIGEVSLSESDLAVMDLQGQLLVSVPLNGPQARLDAVAQMRTQLPFLI